MERKSMMRRAIKNSLAMLSVVVLLLGISLLCGNDDVYAAGTSPSSAQSISFGKYYSGSFSYNQYALTHYYKFRTSSNKNARYALSVAFTSVGQSLDFFNVGLYDEDFDRLYEDGVKYTGYSDGVDHGRHDFDIFSGVDSLTYRNLKPNSTYYVAIKNRGHYPESYSVKVNQTIVKSAGTRPTGQVKILNTIANTGKRTNDVIWDKSKVRGATHYQINWRKRGASSWNSKTVGNTVRGTTSNLTIGGLYEIRVRPVKAETATTKVAYGVWSPTVYRYFHTTQKIRLKSSGIGSFTMSWARNSAASGYQVMYTTNKNGSGAAKNINSVGSGASSFTKRWLQSGRTYYVQVREIRRVGNINYIGNISVPVGVRLR